MAEQEVVKHTKKIFSIWSDKENGFLHKLKEFLLEIFIIVFAITLSIWFHNRGEHAHQQKNVKQFLIGLKSDLKNDIVEMESDRQSYIDQKNAFQYISGIKMNQQPNGDTIIKYSNWIFNTTALNPNNGRFEGFKASGKIGDIENDSLQNDIMDLYQEDIVSLLTSTDSYIGIKRKFFDYINQNRKRLTDSTSNLYIILVQDEGQNFAMSLRSANQIIIRYTRCIEKMRKIIEEINEEYHLKD